MNLPTLRPQHHYYRRYRLWQNLLSLRTWAASM